MIAIIAWQQWSSLPDMQIWLKLVSEKCTLMEREADYVYYWRAAHLDALHEDIEYQLRCIIQKPGRTRTTVSTFEPLCCILELQRVPCEIEHEARLLQMLINIIERKNALIQSVNVEHKTATSVNIVEKKTNRKLKNKIK
jgi:hypothetical protein